MYGIDVTDCRIAGSLGQALSYESNYTAVYLHNNAYDSDISNIKDIMTERHSIETSSLISNSN